MLIEFHVIQEFGPSNLNRDQEGRPKKAFYAGSERLRISSQCLKRVIRQPRRPDQDDRTLGVFEQTVGSANFGVRTRLLPERVAAAWQAEFGADDKNVEGIKAAVSIIAQKDSKQDEVRPDGKVRTPQAIYLDLDREVERIIAILKDLKAKDKLDDLADPAQIFADNLGDAAKKLQWPKSSPEKDIAWASVRAHWPMIQSVVEAMDVADRPDGFEPSTEAEKLTPSYDLAYWLLRVILKLRENEAYEDEAALSKSLKPERGAKKVSGAKVTLADSLKCTSDRPISAADIALFGRMTTSDAFRDIEAACQVADAISTHPAYPEYDYFTAVDDLATDAGAAHLGESQFASAVFYKYLSVDHTALCRNLGAEIPDDKKDDEFFHAAAAKANDVAAKSIEGLLRALMLNVPRGKINSHAQNQQPSLILVEVKQAHVATSYLTAFHDPARAGERENGTTETLLTDSIRKLLAFAQYRNRKMAVDGTQRFLFINDPDCEQAVERLRNDLKKGNQSPLTDDEFFSDSTLKSCDAFNDLVAAVNAAVAGGRK
ncbi:MAG: type I-E CRISPR-associated protein Cas7/Cse4/CasC [Phycisphaerae bacterium]|nr:type I-E CRISPR-associated protein Cas7/Cse4/CasC [Phycisphaerae bacterium]